MSILTLIVAAWLVDIEAFAEFGVYQTFASLAWIALFLRYEAAIVAAQTDEDAGQALRLCLVVGGALWIVFSVVAVGVGTSDLMRMQVALLLPLSNLARGILRLAFVVTTRIGDFKGLGRGSLVQALLQPTTLLILVLSPVEDTFCFVIADIVGHGGWAAYLVWRRRQHLRPLMQGWAKAALTDTARQWKNLPIYNLPASFLGLAFVLSPLLIMPIVADDVLAGHMALAYRIFDVPTQIITGASTPIFLNRLRPSADRANPIFHRHVMLGLIVVLGAAYAAMAGLLILADPLLNGTGLGNLAEVVPYVALFQLFVALAAPVGDSCALFPQQKRLMAIHGLAVLAGLAVVVLAPGPTPYGVLLSLALLSGLRTLALGELLHKLSSISRRAFTKAPISPAYPAP